MPEDRHVRYVEAAAPDRTSDLPPLFASLLDFIYTSFRRVVPYDRLGVALLTEDREWIRLRWARSIRPIDHLEAGYGAPLAGSSLDQVLRSGRPRILNDLEGYLREHPGSKSSRLAIADGIRSSLTCPLQVDGEPVGALFFSKNERGAFREEHASRFLRIADDVGEIVSRWGTDPPEGAVPPDSLGEILARIAQSIDSIHRESAMLAGITERVNAGVELDEVLDHVFESFHALIPYDRIGLALMQDHGRVLRAVWARSRVPRMHLALGFAEPLAGSTLARVLQTGEPRILNDLPEYLRNKPQSSSTRLIVREGMKSSLTCPLVVEGRPIGCIFFASCDVGAYRNAHVETYVRLANQLSIAVEKSRLFGEMAAEQARSEALLDNLLPDVITARLKVSIEPIADSLDDVAVLFVDIVGFTRWAGSAAAEDVVEVLNRLFSQFDRICKRFGLRKIRTMGDAYLAVAGAPAPLEHHLEAATSAALAMMEAAGWVRTPAGGPLQLRIGLHCGAVVAGVVGETVYQYDVWGATVNMAARMEQTCPPGEIQVSGAVRDRLSPDFRFREPRRLELKGIGETQAWLLGTDDSLG